MDLAGNRSPGAGTYPYFRANYVLNYPGAQNVTSFYPGFNATYPVTQNVDLLLPVRPGYRFEGWALSPVQSTNLINQYTFNGNANFFARWAFYLTPWCLIPMAEPRLMTLIRILI